MITPDLLRELAAEANEGHSVELSPEELTGLADQLEHPQCGGAAQTMLALMGDAERREFERAYVHSAAHEMELTQQRLAAAESENADFRRELKALRGELASRPFCFECHGEQIRRQRLNDMEERRRRNAGRAA